MVDGDGPMGQAIVGDAQVRWPRARMQGPGAWPMDLMGAGGQRKRAGAKVATMTTNEEVKVRGQGQRRRARRRRWGLARKAGVSEVSKEG